MSNRPPTQKLPGLTSEGILPEGIHTTTWADFVQRFGTNKHRLLLLNGLSKVMCLLCEAGCECVYLDGSFVTSKENPNDIDMCWEKDNVDLEILDFRILMRNLAKGAFNCDMFMVSKDLECPGEASFVKFFQQTKDGKKKGIVRIEMRFGQSFAINEIGDTINGIGGV